MPDPRIFGWVAENPAVHEALEALQAEIGPTMQVAFLPDLIDGELVVAVRPSPDASATHAVRPDGETIDLRKNS